MATSSSSGVSKMIRAAARPILPNPLMATRLVMGGWGLSREDGKKGRGFVKRRGGKRREMVGIRN